MREDELTSKETRGAETQQHGQLAHGELSKQRHPHNTSNKHTKETSDQTRDPTETMINCFQDPLMNRKFKRIAFIT